MWGGSNVVLDRPVGTADVPLVGRDALIDELLGRLDAGRSTLVLGAPDTGRSRLLDEIRARHGGFTAFLRGTDTVDLLDRADEGRPRLVLVDDLHRLRRRHVEVVARAVASSSTVCVATALAGVRLPFTRAWPWNAGAWGVARLAPLDVRAVTELATHLLGAPPELALVGDLHAACGGQPRATSWLLERAVTSGCVWFDGELWRRAAPLPTYDLGPRVERDLAALSPRARADAELLALGGPLLIPVAARLLTSESQRELVRRGITVVRDGGDGWLELVQPVMAQVLRDGIDDARRADLLRQLAEAHDRDHLEDGPLLRLARWRLEIGGWSPARWDNVAAVAWRSGHLDVARAAVERGSGAAASLVRSPGADGWAEELFAAFDRCEDPADAVRHASAAWPFAGSLERGLLLLASGGTPLERYARAMAEQDEATADRRADAAWWAMVAGRCARDAGSLTLARVSFLRAARALASDDPVGLAAEVALDLAHTAALAGAPSEASAHLDEATSNGGGGIRRELRAALIHTWLIAHRYGPDAAAGPAVEVGDRAWGAGSLRIAVDAWHLAVRFGAPEVAAERLHEHRDVSCADVGRAREHAQALAASDAARLHSLAIDLAEDGRVLLAAEVAAQATRAGRAHPAVQDGAHGGVRGEALAPGLLAACPDVHTPALRDIAPARLTPRERLITSGVVRGDGPRAIARRLGVSLRTVENHLSRIYRTLGVADRAQLQGVYGHAAPLLCER